MEFAGVRPHAVVGVSTRALPHTHEHASCHPHARAHRLQAVRLQQLQHNTQLGPERHAAGASLISADARTHMHCDSTRKPTVATVS